MRAHGNGEAGSRAQWYRFLMVSLPTPHLTRPAQYVPDFIHGVVGHRTGYPVRTKFEMRHSTAGKLQQNAHIRAIWREHVTFGR